MNKLKIQILFFTLLLSAVLFPALGQNKVGTTSFQFLEVPTGTRASAMGDALVASPNSSESLFYNPAGIVDIPNLDIQLSRVNWFVDTKISSFSVGYKMNDFSLGLFGEYINYGQIQVTTVHMLQFNESYTQFNPGLTGEVINPYAMVLGAAFAKSLTDKFSFGLALKYAREDFIKASASAFAIDGGIIYKTGFKSIELGANVRNFGLNEVKFIDQMQVTKVNPNYDPSKDPPSDSLMAQTVSGEKFPIPQSFSFGVSAYLISPNESLFLHNYAVGLLVSYELITPRDYSLQHKVGAELSFMNILFVRGGYKFNFDEEGFTFGLGINFLGINVGYSYDPFGTILDAVNSFSVGYSFK